MHPRAQQRLNGLLLILFLPTVCTLLAGCHRSYYRHQADMEVAEIIGERSVHPHWPLDFNIDVDPGSRMIDPHSADHPAMPQDDPVAHQYMHEADNKSGYPCWDVNGHSLMVENPEWKAFLPVDEDGVLRITAEDALALAQVHSPDYQQQWETLYLAALDVSAERFAFDTQYFFGYEPTYDAVGRLQTGSSSTSTLGLTTRTTQAQRAFTNGASLVVGLANSLIWQFSGSDSHTASTIVDFTLVQPLLQSAGRDRVMESLTLSERSLLYNVRQMERYRRGFYLDIVSGTGAQPGPVRGGFAAGGFQGGAVGRAGGFLGLLQTQQNIRNQEVNLAQLRSSFELVKLQFDAGTVDFSDREQVKQDLFNSASGLISARRAYGDTLDGFKRDLGLPPTVKMELVDDRLSQFNLIDPDLVALQNTTTDLQRDVGNVVEAFLSEKEAELDDIDNATFTWTPTIAAGLRQL
ncbi:MAG: TolC family protein, partial [Pirellulaceae bacterium]|nr:TolC family protein [Pirellulaceae bacterium]